MADEELDRLYALPLEEFTAARNELAKARGDSELKKLKKPTVAAWAVNQLAREREVDLRRLLRAGERLEAAQKDAVLGGDQRPFEEARAEERDALRRLRGAAAELLRAGGNPASDPTLDRVVGTLRSAGATEDGRAALREGRLSEELEPSGFEALAGLAGAKPKRRPARSRQGPTAADRRRARKAREEADDAQREARDAAAQVNEAERALAKAKRAADAAAAKAVALDAKARELEGSARG